MWARIEGNVVANVTTVDPEGRFHPSFIWISCPPDVVPGMHYDGEKFEVSQIPELSSDERAKNLLVERDRLLWVAAIRIAPLQDSVDLNEATAAEVESLKQWKQYRVRLNRIEQQTHYPLSVEWPDLPQPVSQLAEMQITPPPQNMTLARKVTDFILQR